MKVKSQISGSLKTLFAGGLAAIAASACCLGPLVLITLGISGAWISNLTLLEPYRPVFIALAVVALYFAYRKIWQSAAACQPDKVCASPPGNRVYKMLFWIVVVLVAVALLFPYVVPWFY